MPEASVKHAPRDLGETPRAAPMVHIVDLGDDAQLLSDWVRAAGLSARSYDVLGDFADGDTSDAPSCLVVDAQMAGRTDSDIGDCVQRLGLSCPVVVTAYGAEISTAVVVMKTGAIDFVEKPFRRPDILDAIDAAIRRDSEREKIVARQGEVRARFATLSTRERQVMELVTSGKLNKQAGGDLGISEITVKAHRGRVTAKMGARSFAELVTMGRLLGLGPAEN